MSDLVTSRIFVDGEKGITAAKLNDIVASSVIQPAFYTSKPTASTADPTDVMLLLKSGAYAQVPMSTITSGVDASQIWSVRLRSFNAVGNPNFEVDQRQVGNTLTNPATGTFPCDRWYYTKSGTMTVSTQRALASSTPAGSIFVPGTNYLISSTLLGIVLGTQEASLGAGDFLELNQTVEGPQLRELLGDVHSLSLLVYSSVANLKFSVVLVDGGTVTKSLCKLCTIPAANTWTLITLPNLPVWASGGNFNITPGAAGYSLRIGLAAGTTYMPAANDTWQNGNFVGAVGMSNFAASPVNSVFYVGFVQHEPGPVCSTLIDKPFTQNLDECLRYFEKSNSYKDAPGNTSGPAGIDAYLYTSFTPFLPIRFKKIMAKNPTVTGYSPVTGAINNVRDFTNNIDRAINTAVANDGGFAGFNVTPPASPWRCQFHYTADTGW